MHGFQRGIKIIVKIIDRTLPVRIYRVPFFIKSSLFRYGNTCLKHDSRGVGFILCRTIHAVFQTIRCRVCVFSIQHTRDIITCIFTIRLGIVIVLIREILCPGHRFIEKIRVYGIAVRGRNNPKIIIRTGEIGLNQIRIIRSVR